MPPAGFKTTILAGERPQNYALDRAATGTGTAALKLCILSTRCICVFSKILKTNSGFFPT